VHHDKIDRRMAEMGQHRYESGLQRAAGRVLGRCALAGPQRGGGLRFACHSRFGRGRGNGTSRRSTAVRCTSVVSWVGLRKAAIGSLGGGLGTEEALGIEPVTSSLAGTSLPPLVLFRIAKKPNTRIATTAIPCRVRRLRVSQGTAKRCCIIEPPVSPWRRAGWEFYSTGT
jgi:hypothetical protein